MPNRGPGDSSDTCTGPCSAMGGSANDHRDPRKVELLRCSSWSRRPRGNANSTTTSIPLAAFLARAVTSQPIGENVRSNSAYEAAATVQPGVNTGGLTTAHRPSHPTSLPRLSNRVVHRRYARHGYRLHDSLSGENRRSSRTATSR